MAPQPLPLPLLLISFILALLLPHTLSARVRPAPPRLFTDRQDDLQTIAEIINPLPTEPPPNCCLNVTEFDIFARLARETGVIDDLSTDPITLLVPTDVALNVTASDISFYLDFPPPVDENDAHDYIKAFVNLYENPDDVLRDILLFHILNDAFTKDEIISVGTIETRLPGESIEYVAQKLQPSGQALELTEAFPLAGMVFGPTDAIKASNGLIIVVDRMIIPNMSRYPKKPSQSAGSSPAPSQFPDSPAPTNTDEPQHSQSIPPTLPPTPSSALSNAPTGPLSSSTPSASPSITPEDDQPECFPASARVTLQDGRHIPIVQLVAGYKIMSTESKSSPVYLFTHKEHSGLHTFIRIESQSNHTITLSQGHYIHADGRLKPASQVKVGNTLRTLDGPAIVKSVRWTKEHGLIAPHTMHGDIVVNRVVASTYTTAIHPIIAHTILWPLRFLAYTGVTSEPIGDLLYSTRHDLARLLSNRWIDF